VTQQADPEFAYQASKPTAPSRAMLLFGLTLLSVANAIFDFVYNALHNQDLAAAVINGLGVSWAFWVAWGLALALALRAEPDPADHRDLLVAAVCVGAILVPNHHMSTLAATLAAGWFALRPEAGVKLRAAALILLALTVNLLWARAASMVVARPVEFADAHMVALLTHASVHANVVPFVNGPGSYLLLSGCTSIGNASMALLLWIAIARSLRPQPRRSDWLIAAGIMVTVVAINLVRLSLMAQSLAAFEYWHGGFGAVMVNLAITTAGLSWAVLDTRHEILA
jgi:hypothetical protein